MALYHHDGPLPDDGPFVGRDRLLRTVPSGLRMRRSFALCGGPRTGRTSTLRRIARQLGDPGAGQPIVPVQVEFRPETPIDPRSVATAVWQAITEAVTGWASRHGAAVPTLPQMPSRRTAAPLESFTEVASQFWKDLAGTPAWCNWALLVDGGDRIATPHTEEVARWLATLVDRDPAWAPVGLVIAGGRPLREQLLEPNSPFHALRPALLGALRSPAAESLVALAQLNLDSHDSDKLCAATGRHPYALQRLLAELHLQQPRPNLEGAVSAAAGELADLFQTIWDELDGGRGVTYRGAYAAPEHALMQLLLDFEEGCTIQAAEQELGIRPLREYAELLEYFGVVERQLAGTETLLKPHFDLWNTWYGDRILD